MVVVGTGTVGSAILNKDYPYEEGLIAGTTEQTDDNVSRDDMEVRVQGTSRPC